MSVSHYVYIGSYIRIQEPEVEVERRVDRCRICGKIFGYSEVFCSSCGKQLPFAIVKIRSSNIGEILYGSEQKISDYYFQMTGQMQSDENGYICIGLSEHGTNINLDDGDEEIPVPDKAPDSQFADIIEKLIENNIPYEIRYGAVAYVC